MLINISQCNYFYSVDGKLFGRIISVLQFNKLNMWMLISFYWSVVECNLTRNNFPFRLL